MLRLISITIALSVWLPALAHSQASIVGVVRDTSGAVLPGVTVEVASPALIEKTRAAVTSDTGQFRIESLRPGTYSVAFTLPGFTTVVRDGIELTGNFTATINTDLRVGTLEETVTVQGAAPVVDVQGTTRQQVIRADVADAIPSGRHATALAMLIPGVRGGQVGDVGGTSDQRANFDIHGSTDGGRLEANGLRLGVTGGANTMSPTNMSAVQELAVDTSGVSAEVVTGGVRVNMIPREGGNRFSGTSFATFTTEALQGDNFDAALRADLGNADALKRFWDVNPGVGGPILRDRLWFYGSYKNTRSESYVAGAYVNRNANNPNVWTYDPDLTSRPFNRLRSWDMSGRLTWQAHPKLKIGASGQESDYCNCSNLINSSLAVESSLFQSTPRLRNLIADWTAPLTSRLLIDGAVLQRHQDLRREVNPDYDNPQMISVTEQSLNNLIYRTVNQEGSNPPLRTTWFTSYQARAALSYITGAHAFKSGFTYSNVREVGLLGNALPGAAGYSYRFNNGVPNRISLYGYPVREDYSNPEVGVFAQDKWTVGRVTASGGVRYDYYTATIPATTVGPTPLLPLRNLSFPESKPVAWHDITPKTGIAIDVFGTGKTAVKATLNKYLDGFGRFARTLNPATRIGNTTTRAWNDSDRDFVPDCDLVAPSANGECGPLDNQNFGGAVASDTYDRDILFGWGRRSFNWEFSTGVQHELLPRVSLDVSYFRRWFGNFYVTDNRAASATDFSMFSVVAPTTDTRLPSAGQTIGGFYNLNPDRVGRVDNFITDASNYGKQTRHWNGVDVYLNARMANGLLVQGGTSTGRGTANSCEILAALPETAPTNPFCNVVEPWLTEAKFLASYLVPRVGVQLSGTVQSTPGPLASANFVASNAIVAPSLGRPLSGNAANVTLSLIQPGSYVPDRVNQVDVRLGKRFTLSSVRALISLDVSNVLNANPAVNVNSTFGGAIPWLAPRCNNTNGPCDSVMRARLFKISTQVDF